MTRAGKISPHFVYAGLAVMLMAPTSLFGQGACCQPDGSCGVTLPALCDPASGEYMGDGTTCLGDNNGDLRDDVCPCIDPPLPGCGDCNGNGVTDSEDLLNPAACSPAGSCADCNVTFLPDGCEMIPGTCVTATSDGSWSDPTIWLLGGDYPDNVGHVAQTFVTIPPSTSVALDTTVEIEGLSISQGAVLSFSSPSSGDLVIRRDAAGGLRADGAIDVRDDHQIDVSGGTLLISGSGSYRSGQTPLSAASAHLTANRVVLLPPLCGTQYQFSLSGQMTATVLRDFVMDGRDTVPCTPCGGKAAAGGKTPPILRINPGETAELNKDKANNPGLGERLVLDTGGDFQILNAGNICVGCTNSWNDPLPVVRVGGDFDNRSIYPSVFNWKRGKLLLTGAGASHVVEAAGLDLGPFPEGFDTTVHTDFDTCPHHNFSMTTVELEAGAQMLLANNVANSSTLATEALYVENLLLRNGSELTLGDANLYYCHLLNEGATIAQDGLGRLIQAQCEPMVPTVSQWGVAILSILLLASGTIIVRQAGGVA